MTTILHDATPTAIVEPWSALLAIYQAEAEACSGERRARLLHAQGQLLEERLQRRREALRAHEEALRADPSFHPARRACKRLYREMGQPEMIGVLLAGEAEVAATPLLRAQVCWEHGQVLESLADAAGAVQQYRAALAADPGFLPALFALEPHLSRQGDWAGLAAVLTGVLPNCPERADQAALLTKLGRLREAHLGDVEGAITAYRQAAELCPQEVEALAALERLCRRLRRWSELAAVLEQEAALSDGGPAGASTLLEVARIRSDLLGDAAGARAVLEAAVTLDPAHRPSLDALSALLAGQGDRARLAAVLERWAAGETEPRERADLLYRRAQLLFDLGQTEPAVAALQQAHHSYPHHRSTLQALGDHYRLTGDHRGLAQMQLEEARGLEDPDQRSRALLRTAEILEGKLGDTVAAVSVLREALATGPGRLAAIRELSRLLGKLGHWSELEQVLAHEADRSTDSEQALQHLQELARVRQEHLDDLAGAAAALERARQLRPELRPVLEQLVSLYRALGQWSAVISTLEGLAELLADSRSVVAVLTDAGRAAEDGLADLARADDFYERALRLHPGYLPALRLRGRLLSAAGRWEELLTMHRRSLDVAANADERADLHDRIASLLANRLDRPDEAAVHYREALQARPGDISALKALEISALRRGNREELAEVLRLQAEAASSDPMTAAQLLCRRGVVLEGLADGEGAALSAYQQALQLDASFLPAHRSLVRLHGAADRWEEVAAVIDQMLEVEQDPAQRVLLLMRLATIQREQLGRPEAAREAYERVLALDPGHPSALRAQEEILRRVGEPQQLVPVLESRARSLDDPLLVGAYLLEIDRLGPLATRAGKSPEAMLVRAMKQEPWARSSLERLEGLLARRLEPGTLADFYERALAVVAEETTRNDLETRRIGLLEQAGRTEEAEQACRSLLERCPDELPLVCTLQRLLLALGDRPAWLRAVEREGELSGLGERVAPLLLAAGDEWRERGEYAAARRLYELTLRRHPDGLAALLRLESLLAEHPGGADELPRLFAELLPTARTAAARLELHLRLAASAERDADLVTARGHLAAALAAVPDDLRAHHAHARILDELNADEPAAKEWLIVAEHPDVDPVLLRTARLALGRLWGLALGQAGRARTILGRILEVDDRDREALTTLQEVLASDNRWDDLEAVIEQRLALAEDPEEKVEIVLEWARLEEEERRDRVSAYQLLQEARKIDPSSPEPVRQLGRILWEDGAFDTLRTLFLDYADGLTPRDVGRAVPFLTQLGRLYMENFATIGDAVALLERVLQIDPSLLDVRQDLAMLYGRQSETLAQAVEQHQLILDAEPLEREHLVALFNLFERLRAHDRAFAVGGVLEYVGALSPEDRVGMEDYRTKALRDARRDLSPAERESLLAPRDAGEPLDQWLRAMARELSSIFPDNLKARGVTRDCRVSPRAQDPVLNQCNRLAVSLGVKDFQLYRLPSAPFELEVAATDPPALLLCNKAIEGGWTLAQRRFNLARAISSLGSGLHVIAALGEETTAALLLASVRLEGEAPAVAGIDESTVDTCRAALAKGLNKRLRRPLAELGRMVLNAGEPPLVQIQRAACSMHRAGLFFASDATVALCALAGPPRPEEEVEAALARLRGIPAVLELVAWLLSDRYAELRHGVGIAVE